MKVGCLGALLGLKEQPDDAGAQDLPYYRKNYLLTKAEASFYHALLAEMPEGFAVMCKVRLLDVVGVNRGSGSQAALNRVDRKHLDFVICERESLRPRLAIELDDASHQSEKAQARDAFIEQVLGKVELPLYRPRAARSYSPAELRGDLVSFLQASE